MKRITVVFFNNDRKYVGWKYMHNTTYREVRNWCLSGNFVTVEKRVFNFANHTKLLTGIYRRILQ